MRKKSIVNGLWVGLSLVIACFYPFYHFFPARYVASWRGLGLPQPLHVALLILGPALGLALLVWQGRTVGLGGITAGALTGLVAALIVYAALIGPAVVLRGSAPLFIYALEPHLRDAETFTRDVAASLLDIMRWSYLSVVIVLLVGTIIGVVLGSLRPQPEAPAEGKDQEPVAPRPSPADLWRSGGWGAALGLLAGGFSFGSAFVLSRRLVSLITGAGPWGYVLFFLVCGLAGALGGVRVRSIRERVRPLPLPSKVEDLWAVVVAGAHSPPNRMEGAFWGALVGLALSAGLAVIRPSLRLAVLAEFPLLSLPSGMVPWLPLTLLGAVGGWMLAARLRPEPTLPDPSEGDLRAGVMVGILLGIMASLGLFTPVYALVGKIIAGIQGQENFLLTMSYSLGLLSAPLAFLFPLVLFGGGALAAYQVSRPPSRLRSRLRAGAVAGATGGAVFYVMFIAAALNVVLGDAALARYGLTEADYLSPYGLAFLHRLVSYLFEAHLDVLAVTVSLSAILAGVEALLYCLVLRFRRPLWQPVDHGYHLFQSLKKNPTEALPLLYDLLDQPEQAVEVLPHLALYAQADGHPQVARLAVGYRELLRGADTLRPGLTFITEALKPPLDESWRWGAEVSHLYRTLEEAARANSIARITALRPAFVGQFSAPLALEYPLQIMSAVVDDLRKYQHVSGVLDKVAYLVTALEHLRNSAEDKLRLPERVVFASLVKNWTTLINNALREVQGQAQPEVTLKTRHLPTTGPVDLVIRVQNIGQGPAERLRVALIPHPTYRAMLEEQEIPLLSAGEMVEQTWPLEPLTADGFRVEFALRYDDRTGQDHWAAFADQVLPLHVAEEFSLMPNPYSPGAPLRPDSTLFFGREDVFAFIEGYLAGAAQQKILILIGERRTGKTSILKRLPQRLSADYVSVYVDGQSLGIDAGLPHFFRDLAWEIGDALNGAASLPPLEDFQAGPKETFERRFLPGVYRVLAGRQLLLLFDEFEELEIRVHQGKLPPLIFPYLRHLMQHKERLAFIFAGTHRLEEMTTDYWSVLFNIAFYHRIGALDDTAARALIAEPVRPYHVVYDDLALDKILRVTAGHPYFLQLLCFALVNYRNQARKNYITLPDVNHVLEEVVQLGQAHFSYTWDQAAPLERAILIALAHQPEGWATHSDLARLLADQGPTPDLPTVLETLEGLTQRELLTEQGGRYRLKMPLIGLWLRRFKTQSP